MSETFEKLQIIVSNQLGIEKEKVVETATFYRTIFEFTYHSH